MRNDEDFESVISEFDRPSCIFDEGDLYVKKRLIEFDGKYMKGLASLKYTDVFLFSATMSPYWRACLMAAM